MAELIKVPTRPEITQRMFTNYLIKTNKKELTNLNEGSMTRILLDTVAYELDLSYTLLNTGLNRLMLPTAIGNYLDSIGDMFETRRLLGSISYGILVIKPSSTTPTEYDITIPKGTVFTTYDDGYMFKILSDVIIHPDDEIKEKYVWAQSVRAGQKYNIPANSVFTNTDPDIDVRAYSQFYGGQDIEEDEPYRERIKKHKNVFSFGTIPYYRQKFKDIKFVQDAYIKVMPSSDYQSIYGDLPSHLNKNFKVVVALIAFIESEISINVIQEMVNNESTIIRPAGTALMVQPCNVIDLDFCVVSTPDVAIYYTPNGKYEDWQTYPDERGLPFYTPLKDIIYQKFIKVFRGLSIGQDLDMRDVNDNLRDLDGVDDCWINIKYSQETPPNSSENKSLGTIITPSTIKAWINYDYALICPPRQHRMFWICVDNNINMEVHIKNPQTLSNGLSDEDLHITPSMISYNDLNTNNNNNNNNNGCENCG